jgi:hypothetical protein
MCETCIGILKSGRTDSVNKDTLQKKPLNDFKDEEQGWEKEFDDVFYEYYYGANGQGFKKLSNLTKDFFRQTIAKEREEAEQKGYSEALSLSGIANQRRKDVAEAKQNEFQRMSFIATEYAEKAQKQLLQKMLAECDKYQNEDGRILVEQFMNK